MAYSIIFRSTTPTAQQVTECLDLALKRLKSLSKPLAEEIDLSACITLLRRAEPFQNELGLTVYLSNIVPILTGLMSLGTIGPS